MSGLDSFPFARHYSGNHGCFLFLRVLRCFSSPRSPLLPMFSAIDIPTLLGIGCPIQRSPALCLFSGSPELIAAYHVFHRLLTPRHPPFALSSLILKLKILPKLAYYMQLSKNRLKLQIPNWRFCDSSIYNLRPAILIGGGKRIRTADPLRARQVLSQLSYTPTSIVRNSD